ncbi:hypothetical protein HMPREF0322_02708 [Desulfitobacterium hafniense DP7]|uniref:Uncharacterized protein n=1 Tax=Desulfitobacterium hafniense DP7 TaxID=537010 RepID=G9XP13_DESHA|nr:hypothetical protein HMPREF0322_02708 [Desulfitobacterium hafniense DP7]
MQNVKVNPESIACAFCLLCQSYILKYYIKLGDITKVFCMI